MAVVVVASVLARLRREPLEDCALASCVEQLCRTHAHRWRDRLLTPVVAVRLMLLQVLHGNAAITHLRQLCGVGFAAASYCEARARVPLLVWQELVQWVARLAADGVERSCIGARVLIADCSSFSMSDTPDLRARFGRVKSRGAKVGVSYPVAKLVGLLDAATGMFAQLLVAPLYTHDLRHTLDVHAMLRTGDVLLGDRAYCSFGAYNLVRLAMLQAAARQKQSVWRISFVDALRWLSVRMLGLGGVDRLIETPPRPGRHQPRVIRRRMKAYDLMTKPREAYQMPKNEGKHA